MKRFVEGENRSQATLFPERLDEYISEDNPVRVIDAFVEALDLGEVGFERVHPKATGRPAYHPSTLLKIYVHGYLKPFSVLNLRLSRIRRLLGISWSVDGRTEKRSRGNAFALIAVPGGLV